MMVVWSSGNFIWMSSATSPNATGSSPYPMISAVLGSFAVISVLSGVKSLTMSSGKIL